jgi:protein-tyrosine-phosphatase
VDPQAIAVMKEKNLDLNHHTSKELSAFPHTEWDVVVGMGCGEECAVVPAKRHILWHIPDPARQSIAVYREVRDVIDSAVKTLLEQLGA